MSIFKKWKKITYKFINFAPFFPCFPENEDVKKLRRSSINIMLILNIYYNLIFLTNAQYRRYNKYNICKYETHGLVRKENANTAYNIRLTKIWIILNWFEDDNNNKIITMMKIKMFFWLKKGNSQTYRVYFISRDHLHIKIKPNFKQFIKNTNILLHLYA